VVRNSSTPTYQFNSKLYLESIHIVYIQHKLNELLKSIIYQRVS